jgi:hypothetical protein
MSQAAQLIFAYYPQGAAESGRTGLSRPNGIEIPDRRRGSTDEICQRRVQPTIEGTSTESAFSAKWITSGLPSTGSNRDHFLQADFPLLIAAARLDYFGFAYDSFKIQN